MLNVIDRALDRRRFRALVEDLGFPAITLRDHVITGEIAWTPILDAALRADRRVLLIGLGAVLLEATPEARTRLDAWRRAPVDAALDDLRVFGDREGLPIVLAALRAAPDAVRSFAAMDVTFAAVGFTTVAWATSTAIARGREHLITLGPDTTIGTVLHEVAHRLHASFGPATPLDVAAEASVRAIARKQGEHDALDNAIARIERLADGCAASWLLAAERDLLEVTRSRPCVRPCADGDAGDRSDAPGWTFRTG
jgi:hypothetical protein